MRRRSTANHIEFARRLRRTMTGPEQRLWAVLRGRRFAGLKFRRQVPIERFVVDFACVERRLIVEVDGDSHADRGARDREREEALVSAGWTVVRVSNDDVLQNLEGVLLYIAAAAGLDPPAWRDGAFGQLPEGTI